MFCTNCGAAAPDGDAFCQKCGAALPAPGGQPVAPQAPAGPSPGPEAPPPFAQAPPPGQQAPPPIAPGPPIAGPYYPPASGAPGGPGGPPYQQGPVAPAGNGGKRGLIVGIVVGVVILAIVAVAAVLLLTGGKKKTGPVATSPKASPVASSSATATAEPAGSVMAVAYVQGAHADAITADQAAPNAQPTGVPLTSEAILAPGGGRPLSELQWSPDGTRLAYVERQTQWGWRSTLYVVTPGNTPQPVSFGDLSPVMVRGYAWISPTELVAAAYPAIVKNGFVDGQLYKCDVEAGTAAPLQGADGAALTGFTPSASSDGGLLAFVHNEKLSSRNVKQTLELLDLGTGGVTDIASQTLGSMIDGNAFDTPVLSPDGSAIFTEQTGSDIGFGVTVYAADGSVKARLERLLYPTGAAWDPSGSGYLAFGARKAESGQDVLYLYNANDDAFTRARQVGNTYLDQFAFSPDGAYLAYSVLSPRHNYRTDDTTVVGFSDGTFAADETFLKDAGWPAFSEHIPAAYLPEPEASATPQPSGSPSSTP